MVFDVAKLESMLRDALDEVSGLETMLVTARARVRRNGAPFSFENFSSKKFLSEHPFPQVAVLKHRLRRVAVQELAEEIGGAAEVEHVLAELESESHRGAAPAKPQSSRPFVPTPTPVACPVAAVAKPPPPMPVASPGAAAAKPVLPRKRERVPVDMDCVAWWNLSRGRTAGKAHALTCCRSKSARPHERAQGKLQAMLKADAKETETEGAE